MQKNFCDLCKKELTGKEGVIAGRFISKSFGKDKVLTWYANIFIDRVGTSDHDLDADFCRDCLCKAIKS